MLMIARALLILMRKSRNVLKSLLHCWRLKTFHHSLEQNLLPNDQLSRKAYCEMMKQSLSDDQGERFVLIPLSTDIRVTASFVATKTLKVFLEKFLNSEEVSAWDSMFESSHITPNVQNFLLFSRSCRSLRNTHFASVFDPNFFQRKN